MIKRTVAFSILLLSISACGDAVTTSDLPGPKEGAILLASGSIPSNTSGVSTADILPSMNVLSDETGVHLWAALIYPAGNFLALGPGDTLTARVAGQTQTLVIDPTSSVNRYTADFPALTSGASVTISFMRSDGQTSAPNNVVAIDEPFTVTYPTPSIVIPANVSGANPLVDMGAVELSPPSAASLPQMYYQLAGACIPPASEYVDTSTIPLVGADASSDAGVNLLLTGFYGSLDPTAENCAVDIMVRGETKGVWDPAFNTDEAADVFPGVQMRTIQVVENAQAPLENGADAGQ